MKIVNLIVRILLSLMVIVFGANKLVTFMPPPEGMPEAVLAFMKATAWVMPIVGIIEVVTGLMIISGRFMALGLVMLLPIMVMAMLTHAFLDPPGIGPAAFAVLSILYLAWTQKERYTPILKP